LRQLENRLHIVYVDGFKRFLVLNVVKTKHKVTVSNRKHVQSYGSLGF